MKKKVIALLLVAGLSIPFVVTTSAENNIVNSMDFQDNGIVLTLDGAMEVMLTDNPSIEKEKLNLEEAKVDYDKYKYNLKKAKNSLSTKREDSLEYLQGIKMLEITGEFGMANTQRNYDATVAGLKSDVEKSYFQLLQAQELKKINEENLKVAKDLYEKTKKKLELGLVSKQEVLNGEVNYIKAQSDYKKAENALKNAKMAFNIHLGYDVMTEVKLKDTIEIKHWEEIGIADAVSKAWMNRNEIKAVEYAYEMAQLNMDIIAKQYPEITFIYREQKVAVEKAKKDVEDLKKTIEMEVRSNYLGLQQKGEEIKSGEKSVELAAEALRLSQLSYDVGVNVLTDVQKAQTMLLQAKLGLSQSILDYNLAVLNFENSIGVGARSTSAQAMGQ